MKVLVCGGRGYAQRDKVWRMLDKLHARVTITCIVEGEATGADAHAKEWGKRRRVDVEKYPIEEFEGGYGRNVRMLRTSQPDLVMHFPGGNGTKHMVTYASNAGVRVLGGLDWRAIEEFVL